MVEVKNYDKIKPYFKSFFLFGLSGMFLAILIQESGLFWQSMKPDYPLWYGYIFAALLETAAILFNSWEVRLDFSFRCFLKYGVLSVVFCLTVGGAFLFAKENLIIKTEKLSESELKQIQAEKTAFELAEKEAALLTENNKALEQSLKSISKKIDNTPKNEPIKRAGLKTKQEELEKKLSVGRSKAEQLAAQNANNAKKSAEILKSSFAWKKENFSFTFNLWCQLLARIILQLSAWFSAFLGVKNWSEKSEINFLDMSEVSEVSVKLPQSCQLESEVSTQVSKEFPQDSAQVSEEVFSGKLFEEHQKILAYIQEKEIVKWGALITCRALRELGTGKCEFLVSELEKKQLVELQKNSSKKKEWLVLYKGNK